MKRKLKYTPIAKHERSIGKFLPYRAIMSDGETILTKDGDLMKIYFVGGIQFETVDEEDLAMAKQGINNLCRSIGNSKVAIYQQAITRDVELLPTSTFQTPALDKFNRDYIQSLNDSGVQISELYLTVCYRPTPTKSLRWMFRSGKRTVDEILEQQEVAQKELDDKCRQVENSLRAYGLRKLVCKDGYSEQYQYLNYLITGNWQNVQVGEGPANEYLGNADYYVGRETICLEGPNYKRYASIIEFKEYSARVRSGTLDTLMYLPFHSVTTQSFSMLSSLEGQRALGRQYNHLVSSGDASQEQIGELQQAIAGLVEGKFIVGEYHFSMVIYGSCPEEVQHNVGIAMGVIQDKGFIAKLSNTATEAAWFAQFPGNWHIRPRVAYLTSLAFASLACLHGFARGKADGNPWGDCVGVFKTPSLGPFAFNFHNTRNREDAYGKKRRGNTTIIAPSGNGKTALLNFLQDMAQKYDDGKGGFTNLLFDVDGSGRVAMLARGGRYLGFENGKNSGLAPFQMENTEYNISFLCRLVMWLLRSDGKEVSASEEAQVTRGVHTVMNMKNKQLRSLSTLLQNVTEGGDRNNSIVRRLAKWCYDDGNNKVGEFAWVLDNEHDTFDITGCANIGIDGTQLLKNLDVKTPITMILLHKVEALMNGRRIMMTFEEAPVWLNDPVFCEFAGEGVERIRKKNGICIFVAPTTSAILKSAVSDQLRENMTTAVFLPNPKADSRDYMKEFKLNATEFMRVKTLEEDSFMFLVKQGSHSVTAHLDLSMFEDRLDIYSGSPESNTNADRAIFEMGSDPVNWLPRYHEMQREL